MRSRYMVEKPKDVVFTLKTEGTAAEFYALRDELLRYEQRALPAPMTKKLAEDISKVIMASERTFYPESAPHQVGTFMGHVISASPEMPEEVVEALRRKCSDV